MDGWRAVAIILVLGSHAKFASNYPYPKVGWTLGFFDGDLGVRIFFVLSGFLISLLLLREGEKARSISLRHFYLRRVFRIFPIYFAYLGVLAVMAFAGLYSDSASSWIGCLTFTRNMMGHQPATATAHLWSLAVEEQFYVIWPVLVCVLGLWKRSFLYVGLLLIPVIGCPVVRSAFITHQVLTGFVDRLFAPYSILVYADSLAVGCLGAWMVTHGSRIRIRRMYYGIAMAVCLATIALGQRVHFSNSNEVAKALVPAVEAWAIMGCLLLSTVKASPFHGLLNSRPMVTLGVLSYSIYVWHSLFLSALMGPAFAGALIYDWKIWVFPSVGVAAISYYFFELPLIGLRKKYRG